MNRRHALALMTAAPLAGLRRAEALGNSERKAWTDPGTGVNFWQVTSFPTVNENLYFHSRCWTGDGGRFVLLSHREARRGSGRDLYIVNNDGLDLLRLTDGITFGNAAVHPSKPLCYFNRGREVFTINLDTREITKAGEIEGAVEGESGAPGSFTDDGTQYCLTWNAGGEQGFAVFNTVTGASRRVRIPLKDAVSHVQIEPGGGGSAQFVTHPAPGRSDIHTSDLDGVLTRLPFEEANGHNAWIGGTGRIYTNTLGQRRDILACRPGEDRPEVIAAAPPRYWHTGICPEGDWMVSDTNSPDDGLWLINVKSGRRALLLKAGSSQGHSQYTHPHPCVGPGARHVVFNSDRTGVPHVFCAEIPESLKQSLL